MRVTGYLLSLITRIVNKPLMDCQVSLTNCEGPHRALLNGEGYEVVRVIDSERTFAKGAVILRAAKCININNEPFKFIMLSPRYVGYSIHVLTLVPVTVNIMVIEGADVHPAPVNFIAIGTAHCKPAT